MTRVDVSPEQLDGKLDVERLTLAARLVPEQEDFDLWVKLVAEEYDRLPPSANRQREAWGQ